MYAHNVFNKKVCIKILFSNNDTDIYFVDSDIAWFCSDYVNILTVDLSNDSLDELILVKMILKLLLVPHIWLGLINLNNAKELKIN